jgi:hypothetical protein
MPSNNWRSAARTSSAQRKQSHANAGWKEREEWLRKNPREAQMLEALGINLAERGGLPVVVAESDYHSAAQVGANTATAPQMTRWGMSFMQPMINGKRPGLLLAPFHPGHPIYEDPGLFQNFCQCLVGRFSHPVQDGKIYQLGKGDTKVSPCLFSGTYLVSLLGMILDFWYQDDNDGKLLDTFQRTCRNILQIPKFSGVKKVDVAEAFEKLDLFQLLIRERDESLEKAKAYQEFVDSMQPQILAHMAHTLSIIEPDMMERSVLTSLGGHIMSLMTQFLLGDSGIQLAGVEESILRMILERACKHVPAINVSECYDITSIIEKCHRHAGKRMENELKRWAFVVELLRYVLLRPPLESFDASRRLMREIRERVKSINGITSLCALIAPQASFLDDARLAEIIHRASKADKKRMVLGMSALVSDCRTTSLDQAIEDNNRRADELRRQADASAGKLATRMAGASLSDGVPAVWRTLTEVKDGHRHEGLIHRRLMTDLAAFLRTTTDVEAVRRMLSDAQCEHKRYLDRRTSGNMPPVIGFRKLKILVKNLVSDAILEGLGLPRLYVDPTSQSSLNLFLRDMNAGGSGPSTGSQPLSVSFVSLPEPSDEEPAGEIAFVPLSEAIARQQKHQAEVAAVRMEVEAERDCAICYTGFPLGELANPCALGQRGHQHAEDTFICAGCRGRLSECPICRTSYHGRVQDESDTDSDYTGSGYDSDY